MNSGEKKGLSKLHRIIEELRFLLMSKMDVNKNVHKMYEYTTNMSYYS